MPAPPSSVTLNVEAYGPVTPTAPPTAAVERARQYQRPFAGVVGDQEATIPPKPVTPALVTSAGDVKVPTRSSQKVVVDRRARGSTGRACAWNVPVFVVPFPGVSRRVSARFT
jgi:hypothetical protein